MKYVISSIKDVAIVVILILLYSYNPIIGFIAVSTFIAVKFLNSKKNKVETIIELLIYLIPFSYQSFFEKSGSTYFNFFCIFEIILLLIALYKINIPKGNLLIIGALILTTICIIRTLTLSDIGDSITSLINFLLMLWVPLTIYNSKVSCIDIESKRKLYIKVSIAMSFALIISYIMYNQFGIIIGNVNFFGNSNILTQRVNFNLLFNSYSSLSAYLATGTIAIILELKRKTEKKENVIPYLIFLIISVISIGISSSRTGLITFAFISTLIFIKKINAKNLVILLIIGIIILVGYNYLLKTRPGAENIMDENGRFERWIVSLEYFNENIIFGTGFRSSTIPLPHNFILEFLMQGGIIVFFIIIAILFYYLRSVRNFECKYLIWSVLFANLFFTCIEGQTYFNVINIIAVITIKNSGSKNINNRIYRKSDIYE